MNGMMVTRWDILDGAHNVLCTAVANVAPTDWELPTPCGRWTVTQVLQHAAGDQLAYATALRAARGPTEDPFAPSGRLDEAPLTVVETSLAAAAGALAGVGPADGPVPTPLPHGPLPAWLAVGACALDAAIHGWDIAVATGQPAPLTPDLARSLLSVAAAVVEPLRAVGMYAPALPTDGGDDVAALLSYLGRRPGWRR